MKVGMRKPNLKKSLRARTTGKAKRSLNRAVNPFYGKKGVGFVKNPSRSVKNAVYHRTTFGVSDVVGGSKPKKGQANYEGSPQEVNDDSKMGIGGYIIVAVVIMLIIAAIMQ